MKPVSKLLIAACSVTLLATACKKDDNKSRHDMLVGTWSAYKAAIDSNNNNMPDAGEIQALDPGVTLTETFSSNGTGVAVVGSNGQTNTGTFTWTLQNNDNDVRVISNGDTTTARIMSLTGDELDAMVDVNATQKTWVYMKKI